MKNYIFLFLILILVGGLIFLYSRESFTDYSFIEVVIQSNNFMYPDFILEKAAGEERDKLLEDDSDILAEVKPIIIKRSR